MKKILIVGLIGLIVVGVAAVTGGMVFAQTVTPPANQAGVSAPMGSGMMYGRHGRMGTDTVHMWDDNTGTVHMWDDDATGTVHMRGEGFLHDDMVSAIAPELSLTAEELQAKLDAGETMWQIAENKGISEADFTAMVTKAHHAALDQAVANGEITQAQADLMKQNYEAKLASGWLPGRCECQQGNGMKMDGGQGRGGMRGGGQGQGGMRGQGPVTTESAAEPTMQP
ncbi:MAG TPA: hypothetical protein PKW33_15355 [Anaerolineaceae bacterium]|nr:hypothetical protein [Anaerolineaceae bacterium]HPN52971.1 hypothetical protein [Anaerolineaceae bacterium]